MEIHRHSRHRSRAHSLLQQEKIAKEAELKSKKKHHSKKPKIYRDIDREWNRNKFDEDN